MSADPDGTDMIWYYIDWGDNINTGWFGPFRSDEVITNNHYWNGKRNYTISCKAKDVYGDESDWGILEVTTPRNKIATNTLLLRFLEHLPLIKKLLYRFIFNL